MKCSDSHTWPRRRPSASRFHCAHMCSPPAFSVHPPLILAVSAASDSNVHSVLAYEYAWMHGCTRKLGMKICGKFFSWAHEIFDSFKHAICTYIYIVCVYSFLHLKKMTFGEGRECTVTCIHDIPLGMYIFYLHSLIYFCYWMVILLFFFLKLLNPFGGLR